MYFVACRVIHQTVSIRVAFSHDIYKDVMFSNDISFDSCTFCVKNDTNNLVCFQTNITIFIRIRTITCDTTRISTRHSIVSSDTHILAILLQVFTQNDWLVAWDHILSNHSSYMLAVVVAYNVVSQAALLRCKTADDISVSTIQFGRLSVHRHIFLIPTSRFSIRSMWPAMWTEHRPY